MLCPAQLCHPIPQTTGVFNVTTTPEGADVIINGVDEGHSPMSLTLEAGVYNVLIQLAGYYDYPTSAEVKVGETTPINAVLEQIPLPPDKGVINVNSTPSGAFVIINNEDVGMVTPYSGEFPVGGYEIIVGMEGYVTQSFMVDVVVNTPQTLNVDLELESVEPPIDDPSDGELIKWGALALSVAYGLSKIFAKGGGMSKSGVNRLIGKL